MTNSKSAIRHFRQTLSCGPMAFLIINFPVRQFGPEEPFSLGVEQGGCEIAVKANARFARGKRVFLLARWWMWCLWRCVLWRSLSCSHSLSINIFLHSITLLFHILPPSPPHSLDPTSSVTFSPSSVSHTGIYCNWLSPPPPPPPFHFLPLCLPVFLFIESLLSPAWAEGDLLAGPGAATQDMGPASLSPLVSCVAASGAASLQVCRTLMDQNRWIPIMMDLYTLLFTLQLACALFCHFYCSFRSKYLVFSQFKINKAL